MLTQYTTYDEIRAALGVAQEEIEDEVLELPNYERMLVFDLEDIGTFDPTLQAQYLTLIDSDATPSPTVDEQRFVSIMKVFCTYSVAKQLLVTLPMFAPQQIKESKTELVRISDPYKDAKAGVTSFYEQVRARLLAAYKVLYPSAGGETARSADAFLVATGLSVDPVTGA